MKKNASAMSEYLLICNSILLHKEFHAIGLPADLSTTALKKISNLKGEECVLSFNTEVRGLTVRGEVRLESNVEEGMYTTSSYTLAVKNVPGVGNMQNAFLCTPFNFVTFPEALNLMEGRYIYRRPDVDPVREGYWTYLAEQEFMPGFRRLLVVRCGFDVRESLVETGLGSWLGIEGLGKLVQDLERGNRCDLMVGTGEGMRAVKVEADPLGLRLKVTNENGSKLRTPNPHPAAERGVATAAKSRL